MKISKDQVNRLIKTYQREAVRGQEVRPAQPVPRKRDRIQLSEAAQEMQRIRDAVNRAPEVREDRVRSLKIQVEKGTYRVDSREIARQMIQRDLSDRILEAEIDREQGR